MYFLCLFKTILVLLAVRFIDSEVFSGKYKVTKVTQSEYGLPIDLLYVSGVITCFMECQKHVVCQSIIYNKKTNACKTNRFAVPSTSLMTSSDPSVQQYDYIGKVEGTLTTIRQTCAQDRHCFDLNSECRDGICKCYYGYAYDAKNRKCGKSCTSYGNTFQVELSRVINGYNEDVISDTTDSTCRKLCLQASTFTCKTYEFENNANTCYLQSVTSLTIPSTPSKFPVANISQIDYGFPLDWFYISGFKRCFMECHKQVMCQSIVYSEKTNVCKTNKVAVPPMSLMTSSDPSIQFYNYIGKVDKTPSAIRQSCSQNTDCFDINSQCRDGICKCYYGYAHDATTYTCLSECVVYGGTFQVELGRYVEGINEAKIQMTTDSNCEALCIQATTFTCRSYEFDYTKNDCYLQSITSFDVPARHSSAYVLYIRDCG